MDRTEKWEILSGCIVVHAHDDDIDALLTMLSDVDEWLRRRGIDPGVPPKPLGEILADRIAAAKCYLARRGGPTGEIEGTITLEWMDDGVWGDRNPADDACYVHGLATRRASAGEGIGLALLRWAEARARDAGKKYLRLDCNGNNLALRAYYSDRAGLTYCGDVDAPTHFASRFEQKLED